MMAVVNNVDKKEQRVKNVLRIVLLQETKAKYNLDDGSGKISDLIYAKVYAKQGLHMQGRQLEVQLKYVLNNLRYWRGDEARRCKKILRKFGGVR